uniref:Uncharacterized protein n=1 Tax=Plectus sambesii TaxID=2011161 RepID=A0A914VAU1_9BILA
MQSSADALPDGLIAQDARHCGRAVLAVLHDYSSGDSGPAIAY